MVHCGEGDCTNSYKKKQLVSKWPGRKFVRFYRMPDPEKRKDIFLQWKLRLRRRPEDVNKNTRVCSEHFTDADFEPFDFSMSQQSESTTRNWIRLKKDAIPNTDRTTGEVKVYFQAEGETSSSSKPGRKRVRRDIGYIDQLINENDIIVGRSPNTYTTTSGEVCEEIAVAVDIDVPQLITASDRYLSVVISADSGNSKGVQCSPPQKNFSTQTGLSSSLVLSGPNARTSSEDTDQLPTELDVESDSEGCSTDGDDEYIPGPALASSRSGDKVIRKTQMKTKGKVSNRTYPISWVYVNIQQLLLLFSYCFKCGGKILSCQPRFTGIAISIDFVCSMCTLGNRTSTWHSSPILKRQFLINVKHSCSLMMSGLRFQSVQNFWNLMELPTLSRSRFGKLVRRWLFPVIYRMYTDGKKRICDRLRKKNNDGVDVVLCGDAQFDSPGYSAKFCTYTIMDCGSNEVVDFSVLQKGQVSGGLEHQAFRQVWEGLVADQGITANDLVIDRQATINKIVDEKFPDTEVSFDIWHMAKSLASHLRTTAKSHPKINTWHRSIVNHLWYSCKTSKGSPDLAVEIFHSCLFHVLNIHNWKSKRLIHLTIKGLRESISGKRPYPRKPVLFMHCKHGYISKRDSRSTVWFNAEDDDYAALFKVVTATRYSNDLRKCAKFLHTGKLESFHSMKLLYLPKLHSFEIDTMIILTMLAAAQNNLCVGGGNLLKTYIVRAYSHANKVYVLKNRNVYDNLTFKKAILLDIEENIKNQTHIPCNLSTTSYISKAVPKTFHGVALPEMEAMIALKNSRLK